MAWRGRAGPGTAWQGEDKAWLGMARPGAAGRGTAGLGQAGRGKARIRHGLAWRGPARHGVAGRGTARRGKELLRLEIQASGANYPTRRQAHAGLCKTHYDPLVQNVRITGRQTLRCPHA